MHERKNISDRFEPASVFLRRHLCLTCSGTKVMVDPVPLEASEFSPSSYSWQVFSFSSFWKFFFISSELFFFLISWIFCLPHFLPFSLAIFHFPPLYFLPFFFSIFLSLFLTIFLPLFLPIFSLLLFACTPPFASCLVLSFSSI